MEPEDEAYTVTKYKKLFSVKAHKSKYLSVLFLPLYAVCVQNRPGKCMC